MQEISTALELNNDFETVGQERLASAYNVTDLATSTMGAVGNSIANLIVDLGMASRRPSVSVEQRLASLWFAQSIYPIDWETPPVWDIVASDYETRDGWIKLHTNLPHHRQAALAVLGVDAVRDKVKAAVQTWHRGELETEIVKMGGVAAAMRSRDEWRAHPQGQAVASEPLIAWGEARRSQMRSWPASQARPLNGLRVLDLTRVLAGPVATRTLAGFGADVLRIDPPGWDEPNVVPDIMLGKRCSFLELKRPADRKIFEGLLASADLLIHGYRPDALAGLGYSQAARLDIAPSLIEVSLDAYGWTGPWATRRGFDSLVQMSCGIAEAGMHWAKRDQPTPLPVQALDHATGYLMAAAAMGAVSLAVKGEGLRNARLSLARTAELLIAHPQSIEGRLDKAPRPEDFQNSKEQTPWGQAHRLKPAIDIEGAAMEWRRPACKLGTSIPQWL
jgi:CoA-transferase family III